MTQRVLLVGEVVVDVFPTFRNGRPGGVFHAAAGLCALGVEYDLALLAPSGLANAAKSIAINDYKCSDVVVVGTVDGATGAAIIGEPTELADQGYSFPSLAEKSYEYTFDRIPTPLSEYSDILVISQEWDLRPLGNLLHTTTNARIHVDVAETAHVAAIGQPLGRPLTTVFYAIGGEPPGAPRALDHIDSLQAELIEWSEAVVIKENRGGGRLILTGGKRLDYPAYIRAGGSQHSVGVGDCFAAVYVHAVSEDAPELAVRRASAVAAAYASTLDFNTFVSRARQANAVDAHEQEAIEGLRVPWESRRAFNVYLAAPDFPSVDVSELDRIERSFRYHNFSPHRPIAENGLLTPDATEAQRTATARADVELIEKCEMLVAVLLNNDPGTLVELGLALSRGMFTAVYDPFGLSDNPMVSSLSPVVSNSAEDVLLAVYEACARASGLQ